MALVMNSQVTELAAVPAEDYDIHVELPSTWHRFETRVGVADECFDSVRDMLGGYQLGAMSHRHERFLGASNVGVEPA